MLKPKFNTFTLTKIQGSGVDTGLEDRSRPARRAASFEGRGLGV